MHKDWFVGCGDKCVTNEQNFKQKYSTDIPFYARKETETLIQHSSQTIGYL